MSALASPASQHISSLWHCSPTSCVLGILQAETGQYGRLSGSSGLRLRDSQLRLPIQRRLRGPSTLQWRSSLKSARTTLRNGPHTVYNARAGYVTSGDRCRCSVQRESSRVASRPIVHLSRVAAGSARPKDRWVVQCRPSRAQISPNRSAVAVSVV